MLAVQTIQIILFSDAVLNIVLVVMAAFALLRIGAYVRAWLPI